MNGGPWRIGRQINRRRYLFQGFPPKIKVPAESRVSAKLMRFRDEFDPINVVPGNHPSSGGAMGIAGKSFFDDHRQCGSVGDDAMSSQYEQVLGLRELDQAGAEQ